MNQFSIFLTQHRALIVDAVIVVVILLIASLKGKKGVYGMAMPFVNFVASIFLGVLGCRVLTPVMLPKYAARLEEYLIGLSDDELVSAIISSKSEILAEKLLRIALFLVCFIAALIIMHFVKKSLQNVADWGPLGWLNHGLGFLIGAIEGIVLMLLIARISMLLDFEWVGSLREGTHVLSWMCDGNLIDFVKNLLTIDEGVIETLKGKLNLQTLGEEAEKMLEQLKNINWSDWRSWIDELRGGMPL